MASDQTQYDLLTKISPYLDKHLLFPLLEHVQEQKVYKEEDVLRAQVELLSKTKLVDFAVDKYKLLHKTDTAPPEMVNRRKEVVAQIKEAKAECRPLLTLLEDPALAKPGSGDNKGYREMLVMMAEKSGITPEMTEGLFKYAKTLFECGNYGQVDKDSPMGAAEFLPIYRVLCKDPTGPNALSALWGKLAAEILLEKWDEAIDDFKKLRELIDTKIFANPLLQLEQRTWLIHWALFVYFKPELSTHPNGRSEIIDLFFSERYLQTIQTNCPHILRYLTTAVMTNTTRRNALKDLVRIIQQERSTYQDPITEFVECLLVNFDFDSAQEKLSQCDKLLEGDYFLGSLKDEFVSQARLFIFETYCRIHQCIDIRMLADKLNMKEDEAEVWIVNLVRNARLDAKIDSEKRHVIMGATKPSVHQQIYNKTMGLCFRSYVLGQNFQKHRAKYDVSADPTGEGGP
uniref:Eukaryotic translation initiation factor 3 subunit E n=1 Tax=Hemiselmis andersenii TaxID=464988 RepID=A0A6U2FUM0_HEMAN|mmetsp:Transcript_33780/g.79132  ORF Transcript_33780/g.79132 Transcript_33780/m.79132 type:complete len:458 (+) Transcript_33780:94-1467(+)